MITSLDLFMRENFYGGDNVINFKFLIERAWFKATSFLMGFTSSVFASEIISFLIVTETSFSGHYFCAPDSMLLIVEPFVSLDTYCSNIDLLFACR